MKEKLLRRKGVIFVLIAFIFMVPSIINAATLKNEPYVQYNFNNNVTDRKGHSELTVLSAEGDDKNRNNSSTSYGSDSYGPYFQWESSMINGGGFYIDIDKNIGEEYTIGLKFSFKEIIIPSYSLSENNKLDPRPIIIYLIRCLRQYLIVFTKLSTSLTAK